VRTLICFRVFVPNLYFRHLRPRRNQSLQRHRTRCFSLPYVPNSAPDPAPNTNVIPSPPGQDLYFEKDQGKPHLPYINELLSSATGKSSDGSPLLTIDDLSRYSAKRRMEAKASNPEFSLAFIHKMFGSSKCVPYVVFFRRLNILTC